MLHKGIFFTLTLSVLSVRIVSEEMAGGGLIKTGIHLWWLINPISGLWQWLRGLLRTWCIMTN